MHKQFLLYILTRIVYNSIFPNSSPTKNIKVFHKNNYLMWNAAVVALADRDKDKRHTVSKSKSTCNAIYT